MDLSHRSPPQDLDQLFLENYQLVFRTAYGVTGRREDAEDVLQSLFLRLLQRGFPPEVRRNTRGYLYRATINLALDRIRTGRRQASREHFASIQSVASAMDCGATEEMEAFLLKVIAELHPKVAELFRLRYADNRSDADIARMLGTSRAVIAVSLCRARAKVRKLMLMNDQGRLNLEIHSVGRQSLPTRSSVLRDPGFLGKPRDSEAQADRKLGDVPQLISRN